MRHGLRLLFLRLALLAIAALLRVGHGGLHGVIERAAYHLRTAYMEFNKVALRRKLGEAWRRSLCNPALVREETRPD